MRGIEAIEYFLENWHSKIRELDEAHEFDALVEYALGNDIKRADTTVTIEKFFDKKIKFDDLAFEDLKTCFLPEEMEFDEMSGNLLINRHLYKIKIAPKIF